jgi:1-acyl-sn-glycerol-3-phosphate acyltransferase
MIPQAVARLAAGMYFRVGYHGAPVPTTGPVLLVANHPNSLLDPLLVLAAARRPVRFLAKAPLFTDRKVGWLVRGFGAIPVYRASDDPAQMGRNAEMFRAVHVALAAGDAVGLFPEGISHSEAALAPLKTGAARIALGAAAAVGAFPVVPVGLVFRDKERFRSEAQVVTGTPVPWDDLAHSGAEDAEAVHLLTERIGRALAALTVNLDHWRDAPIVATAMAIWAAERAERVGPEDEAARRDLTVRILATVRRDHDVEGEDLAADVARHARRLARLHLVPADLAADLGARSSVRWGAARIPLLLPLPVMLALAGWVLFWVPWRLTGAVVARIPLAQDTRSTWKLMVGSGLYLTWVLVLAVLAGWLTAWYIGVLVAALVPLIGVVGLRLREHWRGSWRDLRRWVLLRSRRTLADRLRHEQCELHQRLGRLLQRLTPASAEVAPTSARRSP